MFHQLRAAVVMLVTLSALTGLVYPWAVTLIAQWVFPHQANGSILFDGNSAVGSELIGQPFSKPEYFWGRLSATSPGYNGEASTGSNYGPLNPALEEAAKIRIAALRQHAVPDGPVPVDLVTASGSGLDPHISPAAAEYQVPRVAGARGMDLETVRALVRQAMEGRQWGVMGEPRVHVLRLNLALDRQQASK
ncbi:MAG: potassium-transporting ATPase subunit KdpC [Planctomycetota bacterium]